MVEHVADVLDVEHEAGAMVERMRQLLREPEVDAADPRAVERVARRDLAAVLVEAGCCEERVGVPG